jgi:hypothetical protein
MQTSGTQYKPFVSAGRYAFATDNGDVGASIYMAVPNKQASGMSGRRSGLFDWIRLAMMVDRCPRIKTDNRLNGH